jgi:hypothetical protein
MHTHQWTVTGHVLLGLPTLDGTSQRCTTWRCRTCPEYVVITGAVRHGAPLHTPEYWNVLREQEQRQRTPEAQIAARESRWRIA